MKKVIISSVLVVVVVFTMGIFGCKYYAAHPDVDGLTVDQVRKIRWAYCEKLYTGKDGTKYSCDIGAVEIMYCLGSYDGNIAVKIYDKQMPWPSTAADSREVIIDGVYIGVENGPRKFMLYIAPNEGKKESIMYLKDAYENGYLTKADLENIVEMEAKAQKASNN